MTRAVSDASSHRTVEQVRLTGLPRCSTTQRALTVSITQSVQDSDALSELIVHSLLGLRA